ncbi:MAG TPA: aminotransferase class V-fold PLP-dependent enzyme, partial [Thermoanaerobaculia bacterium]|nr:aminotransferase class V-fold PLP-dependent enzyme [Thermoanaerobaculia bacterium]
MKEHWLLDPSIAYLNHGSFGATPRAVLAKQEEFRQRMEREPVRFLARELDPLLDDVRAELAAFVGATPDDLALLPNATAGVNAVLRSLDLDKHDELLVTSHEYVASRNALDHVASLSGAKVVAVDIPFPIASSDVIVERVLAAVTDRTRLLLVDHISSQTALIFPIERLIAELNARGIDTLVDGAHAPGQIALDLASLGAAYYAGNLHKWVCAPKGSAFLYVRRNRRYRIHPAAIGHGYSATRRDRSRFHLEFDWTGTFDPSAWLAVPEALRFIASLVPGGWAEVRERNHNLALRARDLLCDALRIAPPAPDHMLGSMAAVPLPDGDAEALQRELFEQHAIEVPL